MVVESVVLMVYLLVDVKVACLADWWEFYWADP